MTAGRPLVSVILPTFDRLGTLPRAVNSVLRQTYRDLELIVVDDGSTDGTREWLAGIADDRVRCLRREQRDGAANARNAGIAFARGDLLAFQDSDDEWLPEKLECQVAMLQELGAEVDWIGGAYRIDGMGRGRNIRSRALESGRDPIKDLMLGLPFITPVWLVRRDVLSDAGGFDGSLPCLEDWDLILRLAARTRLRAVTETVLVKYGSPDSLFSELPKRIAGWRAILQRHEALFSREPALHAELHRRFGRMLNQAQRTDEAIAAFSDTVARNPWSLAARLELAKLRAKQRWPALAHWHRSVRG